MTPRTTRILLALGLLATALLLGGCPYAGYGPHHGGGPHHEMGTYGPNHPYGGGPYRR